MGTSNDEHELGGYDSGDDAGPRLVRPEERPRPEELERRLAGVDRPQDDLVETIDEVVHSVEQNVDDERALIVELNRVREAQIAGEPLAATLGEAPRPRLLLLFDGLLERVVGDSGRLRRALARRLLHEGDSVTSIARRFGVTHQRISAIVKRGPT